MLGNIILSVGVIVAIVILFTMGILSADQSPKPQQQVERYITVYSPEPGIKCWIYKNNDASGISCLRDME